MDRAYIGLPFHKFMDGSPVFVKSQTGFTADFGKDSPAENKERQAYFNGWLEKLAKHLNTRTLPVFIDWSSGEATRMDKGCIGHAIAAGKIRSVVVSDTDIVTHVILEAPSS